MKTKLECPYCDGIAVLSLEKVERKFRGEVFHIVDHFYVCQKCSFKFSTDETDTIDFNQVNNLYREKHNIPSQAEIIEIREKYKVTASKLSRILGFGVNTYGQYEKGEIPSLSNSKLIRMIQSPAEFKKLLLESTELETKEKEKITLRLNTMIEAEKYSNENLTNHWFENVNQFTGFLKPSTEKFGNMVLHFIDYAPFRVRLNKLLFYADFLHFKFFGQPISGWMYQALPMGTVPYNYGTSYEHLIREGYIDTKEVLIKDELFDKFIKKRVFNKDLFSASEMIILDAVKTKLGTLIKDEIVKINHQETAWLNEIEKKNCISYLKYGFEIKAGNLVDV